MNPIIVSAGDERSEDVRASIEQAYPSLSSWQIAEYEEKETVRNTQELLQVFLALDPKIQAAIIGGIVAAFGIAAKSVQWMVALIVNTRLKRFELKLKEREVTTKEKELAFKKREATQTVVVPVPNFDSKAAETGVLVRTVNEHMELPAGASADETIAFFRKVLQLNGEVRNIEFFK